ncbi:RHS repeat-associated core domain-containing protein [Allorhizocola rhizosphaerae]|uniref:RHS repeat-associated core domain-containing protein n=1 Tax=Allorhizocola rhizosphaerae TaxID=1872709 RepID=UPI000E3DE42D|nr:RHS repeat-associated core domain-containing protein [Allorhizocola rhizosphaerae]
MTLQRRLAAALTVLLTITLTDIVLGPAADAATGPTVPLENVSSVPVTAQNMTSRPKDEATLAALSGEQKPGTPSLGSGSLSASPLSPSATWQVSGHTGAFTWSYPLRVPPAPGGLEPQLALSYSSSSVDGRTSATNNQASWVGDGWDLSAGFIERVYGACATDGHPDSGHLCWRTDNAIASFPGGGGQLIREAPESKVWRLQDDNGARIERETGIVNGDNDGEHWKITTVDGTQYFFGSRSDARSTWTVPVVGDDANEPCIGMAHCTQAWRWNLDRVVDAHGNEMTYQYEPETHTYAANLTYTRGGTLRAINYAGGRVDFVTADRCVKDSVCTPDRKANWPDVPWTDAAHASPTFWSTKRLDRVTTTVRAGGAERLVDSWTLEHLFPGTGVASDKASLWLRSVKHTGHVGGEIALPAVVFEGQLLANRVHFGDVYSKLSRYRINAIVSETGGVIDIKYREPECKPTSHPNPHDLRNNKMLCYPVKWTPPDTAMERTDYFHKLVVESVKEYDRYGSEHPAVTSYQYLDGAAWHLDTSEFTEENKRTWNEFRGFARVRTRTGQANDPGGSPITMSEQRFHRGMDDDTGPDYGWLAGFPYYQATHLGESETDIVEKTVNTPVWQGPFATRGRLKSYLVRTGTVQSFTALSSGGWRETKTESTYDERGLTTKVSDLGDVATPEDDTCTTETYVRNQTAWILNRPSETKTVAVACGPGASVPDGTRLSAVRTSYDGQTHGAAPTKGDPTKVEVATSWSATGDPHYETMGTAEFDAVGRPTKSVDALGRAMTTAYSATQTVATNPLGHTLTTTLEPAWGLPTKTVDVNGHVTEATYDPLGRVTQVWLPNRTKDRFPDRGNAKFSYLLRNDGPTVISTTRLGPRGNYVTTKTLYDGLMRQRQTQTPAVNGGRLITETRFDTHGRAFKSTQPFFNDGNVDDQLWSAFDTNVPGLTRSTFDGAGRVVKEEFRQHDEPVKHTTYVYGGDRVQVTPPAGAPPTVTITDGRGRPVELIQAGETTKYSYDKAGHLASVTDPAQNTWRYSYNMLGQRVRAEDVDSGVSTATYDLAGQKITSTDARGITLSYAYDSLGRRTSVKQGNTDLATWTYDTVHNGKGMPATATRHHNGARYVTKITGYSLLKQVTGAEVVIPEAAETRTLAGTYANFFTYNADGSLASEFHPEIGGGIRQETITHTYDDFARPMQTYGGFAGETVWYVANTEYTRYGEANRIHLGDPLKNQRAWVSWYRETATRLLSRIVVDAEVPAPNQADTKFEYDPAGNILSIESLDERQCFRYDPQRRLAEAWTEDWVQGGDCRTREFGGPAPYQRAYTYDLAGNRTSDSVRQYTYAKGHQLDGHQYDAAGNTIARAGQSLAWDAQGHLAKVSKDTEETTFVYSADGERLIRNDPTAITLYLPGQELRLDKATGAERGTRYYAHGGHPVAVREGGRLSWLAADQQNTTQVAIDASSLEVSKRRFDPFGAPRGTESAFPGEKSFVGGTRDDSTGLTHLGAREYDPAIGRFISPDPIMVPTDPQQLNAYAYANNNPVTFSDPSGLIRVSCPDGECRGGGWDKGKSPASNALNRPTTIKNGRIGNQQAGRCPDGAKTCKAAVGWRPAPKQAPAKPKPPQDMCLSGGSYVTKCSPPTPDCVPGAGYPAVCDGPISSGKPMTPEQAKELAKELSGYNDAKACFDEGDIAGCAWMVVGLIPVGRLAKVAKLGTVADTSVDVAKAYCSFSGDTKVLMADGTKKPIREIRVGDKVMAKDPETGAGGPREVLAIWVHNDELVDLRVGGSVVTTTDDHPFWNATDKQWQGAGELGHGEHLLAADGTLIPVGGLIAGTERLGAAYNLTVAGIHTYFVLVGDTPVLVHNDNAPPLGPNADKIFYGDYSYRLDKVPGGSGQFEIHVFHKHTEVGFFGSEGWFNKHGHKGSTGINPRDLAEVERSLKGIAVKYMRESGLLKPGESVKGDSWKRPRC